MSHKPGEPRSTRKIWIRPRLGVKTRRPGERGQAADCFVSKRALKHLLFDIGVGLVWALLLAAAIIFMSGVSQFIYVDF